MFRWYVINTYSGHENKVKHNIEHRVSTMEQQSNIRQVVVPTEQVSEMKNGQKVQTERRTMPGYVLVNMEMNDDTWQLVKNTPGRHRVRRLARQAAAAQQARGRPAACIARRPSARAREPSSRSASP